MVQVKSTSIGKLASQFKNNGKKVVLAAADTFRAAAADQLIEWANRAGVDIVSGKEGPILVQYYSMQLVLLKIKMQIFYFVIQQEDFTIKRI